MARMETDGRLASGNPKRLLILFVRRRDLAHFSQTSSAVGSHPRLLKDHPRLRQYVTHRQIYLLILPGLLYFIIFKVAPIWGYTVAFEDFNPFKGILGSKWVGLHYFVQLVHGKYFLEMFRNTVVISLMNLVFYFPAPIILALLLNEIRNEPFRRVNQTILYVPHFMSWVVIAGVTFFLLSVDVGVVNKAISFFGGKPVSFLSNKWLFWWIILLQNVWRETGWGTIIFLAAMSQIDPTMYEAATVDGASRLQQIVRITIPSIMPTIVILFIIQLGQIIQVSFEQILLMSNPYVLSVAQVFDTYAYSQGVVGGNFSIGVAVGIFKSVIGLVMVVTANTAIKRLGQEGIY